MAEVYKIVNMLGPKYLPEMFVIHDSAYDMRHMVQTLSLILVQSYGISLIMKPNKLLLYKGA